METKVLAVYGKNIIVDLGTILNPQVILNNLTINIPQGSIYGLIGPSGCGKTTLQRAIIGVYQINSGSLSVFGQTPGSKGSYIPGPLVGYMPQEIALDNELTPNELLMFLGRCAGLEPRLIKDRIKEILKVMDIDSPNRRTQAFSVGQRRRLSLACSLIHSPRLLLLDEPTVGSDVIVVKKVWDYLRNLCNINGTTIVLSTHYLEEVTKADYFGFMSNGEMLLEGEPKPFMESIGAITFEEAIIKQYHSKNKAIDQQNKHEKSVNIANCPNDLKKINLLTILLLIMYRYFHRWKIALAVPYFSIYVWVFFALTFYVSFYGAPIKDMSLAYLDLSNSSNYLHNITEHLSKVGINTIPVHDEITARLLVENQKTEGYFILPYDFDSALKTRVLSPFNEVNEADQSAGRIILHQDCAPAIKPEMVRKEISEALIEIMDNIATSNGKRSKLDYFQIKALIDRFDEPEQLTSKPITIIRNFLFNVESMTMILLAYWVNNEIHEAMTERLRSLGFQRKHLMTGFILLSTLFLAPVYLSLFLSFIFFYGLPHSVNSLILSTPIIIGVMICGIAKAIFLGTLVKSNVDCLVLNILYTGAIYALGCLLAPQESLVYYIQIAAYLIPHLIPGNALIRLNVYGDGIENFNVQLGFMYTLMMVILHLLLVFYIIRKW